MISTLQKQPLQVSLSNAKSTAESPRLKPSVYQAVKDCINNMNNCVPSLNQSVQELGNMSQFRGKNFEWHTEEPVKGFSDGSMDGLVKGAMIRRMNYLAQLTSNALALVNRFALRHKAGFLLFISYGDPQSLSFSLGAFHIPTCCIIALPCE
ncbi:hypothetical protein L1987_59417 [Smallanthus sonchifolius]|uniref:Uncharacterized protein n=1 Tax=Smallanthus sonchifolius TaxID=185202 RepID=A0ACB9D565_9ASTR|nr:hypothetical protein L1987_59417 [Smallanthus sonchifolius]